MREVPAGHPEKPQGEDGFKLLKRMNGGTHEELAIWGLGRLHVNDADKILDIGCGGGANIRRLLDLAPRGHVTGVDYSPISVQASLEYNAEAVQAGRCVVMEGDVSALSLPDGSFDVATAFETTYYWDLPTAFPEVLRVLKPGGFFLVCNEDNGNDQEVVELSHKIPGMVIYTCSELVEALETAGFEIVSTDENPANDHMAIVARRPLP